MKNITTWAREYVGKQVSVTKVTCYSYKYKLVQKHTAEKCSDSER